MTVQSSMFGEATSEDTNNATSSPASAAGVRARLDVHGSPEYVLTWKSWGMPVGPPICALRASQRRTSGKGFTGWPTPAANEYEQDPEKMLARRAELKEKYGNNGFGLTLGMLVSGWPTTTTMDHIEREGLRPSRTATGRTGGYKKGTQESLTTQAVNALRGSISSSSNAETESTGVSRLNPLFSLWLMGFPGPEWASCAEPVTRSSRR